ncbi:hypothetical protein MNBD_GAMMA11-56, partial [hydrothermal vent metagenome]
MIIIFFYLVFLIIVPQEWIPPFIDMPVDVILFPIWVIYLIVSGKNQNVVWKKNDQFFLYFIIWLLISYIGHDKTEMTRQHAFYYIKWFVMYWLVILSAEDQRGMRSVIKIMLVLAGFIAIEGIFHRFSADGTGWAGNPLDWGGEIDPDGNAKGRVSWIGIFGGPGVFSVLFVMLLPFCFQFLFKPFTTSQKIMGLILSSLFLTIIYFSGSRGGFLGAFAVVGVFGLLKYNISFMSILKIGGLVVTLFMLAPSHLTTMNDSSRSAQHRVEMWAAGSDMVERDPMFGVGRGNFKKWSGKLIAHNSAIEIMGELGFPGFFFWIGMIYAFYKTIYQYLLENNNGVGLSGDDLITYTYVKSLGLSFMGYIVCSFFVTLEYETFYILLALGSTVGNKLKNPVVFLT